VVAYHDRLIILYFFAFCNTLDAKGEGIFQKIPLGHAAEGKMAVFDY
jgi:hypothetical protein